MTMPLDELKKSSFNTSINSTTNFCFNYKHFFQFKENKKPKFKISSSSNETTVKELNQFKQCLNDFAQNFSYLSLIKTDSILNNLKKETLTKLNDLNRFLRHRRLPTPSPSSSTSNSPTSKSNGFKFKSLRKLVSNKTTKLKRLNNMFKYKMVYYMIIISLKKN